MWKSKLVGVEQLVGRVVPIVLHKLCDLINWPLPTVCRPLLQNPLHILEDDDRWAPHANTGKTSRERSAAASCSCDPKRNLHVTFQPGEVLARPPSHHHIRTRRTRKSLNDAAIRWLPRCHVSNICKSVFGKTRPGPQQLAFLVVQLAAELVYKLQRWTVR